MSGMLHASSTRFGEIIVDSDRATTVLLAVLFIVLSLVLMLDIRQTVWGTPNHIAINGTLNRVGAALSLVYCLVLVFRWSNRLIRVGSTLLAIDLVIRFAFTYLQLTSAVRPTLVFIRSATLQISLIIFLVAIANWFRTVVRWSPPSPSQGDGE